MSRRDEVKKEIDYADWSGGWQGHAHDMRTLTRTLADEVDALTAERDEWKRRLGAICEYAAHNKRNQRFIAIAEGKS